MPRTKKAGKTKDSYVHMWAEAMVPELTYKQALLLHRITEGYQNRAHPLVVIGSEKLNASKLSDFGLIEDGEFSLSYRPTLAGVYVDERLKELGWIE